MSYIQKSAQITTMEPNEFSRGKPTVWSAPRPRKRTLRAPQQARYAPLSYYPLKGSPWLGGWEEGRDFCQEMWTRARSPSAILIFNGGGSQGWGRSSSLSGAGRLGKMVPSRVGFALVGVQWRPLLVECGITHMCVAGRRKEEWSISHGCSVKASIPQAWGISPWSKEDWRGVGAEKFRELRKCHKACTPVYPVAGW